MRNGQKSVCPHCGRVQPFEDTICPYCGSRITAALVDVEEIDCPGTRARIRRNYAVKEKKKKIRSDNASLQIKRVLTLAILGLTAFAIAAGALNLVREIRQRRAYHAYLQQLAAEPDIELNYSEYPEERIDMLEEDAPWKDPDLLSSLREGLDDSQAYRLDYLCDYQIPDGYSREEIVTSMSAAMGSDEAAQALLDRCGIDFSLQALKRALHCLSKDDYGPIQLEEELLESGFTQEEADYALSECGADWDQQAELAVRGFLKYVDISEETLTSILLDRGFTSEQIAQTLETVEPDWNREALQSALDWYEYNAAHTTRDNLNFHLTTSGYTSAQIQYALDLVLPLT